ncbi:MAG: beta-propeller fold lactonase family protein [Terracidiphilus sp.]|jgi:6-phosphogluconolactonase (cycloisomerase 2 family)
MKLMKFGKAFLIGALSAGVILSITSCVQSYTVGYLYVTGTVTSGSNGNGYVAGFKIDHNTGKLTPVNGLNPPVPSGGANPVRAVLLSSSRFLYVLNRGVSTNPAGSSICTTEYPCANSNITQFLVGANGTLTPQQTFYTQGVNPVRMIADGTGSYLYVLDHDSPDPASTNSNPIAATNNPNCGDALTGAITCGDITAFQVNAVTGRLQLVVNAQVTSASGAALPYFPVPSDPIDFVLYGSTLLTLNGTPATGDSVFPYQYTSTSGQLTVTVNSSDSIGNVSQATAIVNAGALLYVLDNEPISVTVNGTTNTSPSQILPFSLSSGALVAAPSGVIPDDINLSNPIYLVVGQPAGKWLYVANQGLNTQNFPQSGIAGYVLNGSNPATEIGTYGTGAGPQCLVQDPSNQFFYTANFNDSTVTGSQVNDESGGLRPLSDATKAPNSYSLAGPATWCLVDGRTN